MREEKREGRERREGGKGREEGKRRKRITEETVITYARKVGGEENEGN